jgi:hypothetical protein
LKQESLERLLPTRSRHRRQIITPQNPQRPEQELSGKSVTFLAQRHPPS